MVPAITEEMPGGSSRKRKFSVPELLAPWTAWPLARPFLMRTPLPAFCACSITGFLLVSDRLGEHEHVTSFYLRAGRLRWSWNSCRRRAQAFAANSFQGFEAVGLVEDVRSFRRNGQRKVETVGAR